MTEFEYYTEKADIIDCIKHHDLHEADCLTVDNKLDLIDKLENLDKKMGYKKTPVRAEELSILIKTLNNYIVDEYKEYQAEYEDQWHDEENEDY